MFTYLERHQTFITISLASTLLTTILVLLGHMQLVSIFLLFLSIGIAMVFVVQKHWHLYQRAECTREKMAHNLTRDVLGLLLGMATAIFAGGLAGQWAGMQAGLWAGLAAGFLVGFLTAWFARSLWGRLVSLG